MIDINKINVCVPIKFSDFTLRKMEIRDVDWQVEQCISDYYNEFSDFNFKKDIKTFELRDAMLLLASNKIKNIIRLVLENSLGKLIGGASITVNNSSCEISYFITPIYQGTGIGSSLIKNLINLIVNDLKIYNIVALVQKSNLKSIKVLENNNFSAVNDFKGKLGTNVKYSYNIKLG